MGAPSLGVYKARILSTLNKFLSKKNDFYDMSYEVEFTNLSRIFNN